MILDYSKKESADADRARLEAELSGPDLSEMPEMLHPVPPPMFSKRFKEFVLVGLVAGFVFTVLYYWK